MTTSDSSPLTGKKATNLSLRTHLLSETSELKITISQAAEAGMAQAIAEKRSAIWLKENKKAIDSSNAYVEKHRMF